MLSSCRSQLRLVSLETCTNHWIDTYEGVGLLYCFISKISIMLELSLTPLVFDII